MTFSYWYPYLWVLLTGVVCLFINFSRPETDLQGRSVMRWRWVPAVLLMVPLVLWTAWRPLPFGDSGVYRGFYDVAPTNLSNFWGFLDAQEKDKGYWALEIIFKSLTGAPYNIFFLFIAVIQATSLILTFRKCSSDYWLSIFLFVASADYLSWMHNGMRQFIAVTIIFAFLPVLAEKKYGWIAMVIAILFSSQIHLSALLCIPVVLMAIGKPWNWKTIVFLLATVLIVFFIERFTNFLADWMEDTQYEAEAAELSTSTGTNFFRVVFYSIPTLASFFFRKKIEEANNKLINTCVNLSIASMGFYIISYFTSGLLIGRLPIYFSLANYILIPWMIEEFFERRSARVIKIGFIVLYSAFFYYQVGVTWGLL